MKIENNNIIFTQENPKMKNLLAFIFILSVILTISFFTIIPPAFISLILIPVFLLFTVPIFYFALKNKIIYRFTADELQYRGSNPAVIKWKNIKNIKYEDSIILELQDNSYIQLPYLSFKGEKLITSFVKREELITAFNKFWKQNEH